MNLSKNLTLAEFIHSNTAISNNIDNSLPKEYFDNAKRTAILFELVRTILGRPLKINSGYRSPQLNTFLKGSKTSSHMLGCACDCRMNNNNNTSQREQEIIKKYFLEHREEIEFDQLILYWKNRQRFVHIGVSKDSNTKGRKMIGYRDPTHPKGYSWI